MGSCPRREAAERGLVRDLRRDVILILKINSRIGSLELESLILAQNERWRQA